MDLKSEDSSSKGGGSSGYLADISNTSSYAVPVFSMFDDGYDADIESFDSGDMERIPHTVALQREIRAETSTGVVDLQRERE